MGLAGVRHKKKLGSDPNNTKWSRKTDSFGQKILRAHGWQPGQYLGAERAARAQSYSDASAAHIRVELKEDKLGLGARRNNGDECTGLDAFQDLLGRLNGKSDATRDSERRARSDLRLSLYVEKKVGTVRFVKGGWLVEDELQKHEDEGPEGQEGAGYKAELELCSSTQPVIGEKTVRRKRKAEEVDGDDAVEGKKRKSKERRKEKESHAVAKMISMKAKRTKKAKQCASTSCEKEEQKFSESTLSWGAVQVTGDGKAEDAPRSKMSKMHKRRKETALAEDQPAPSHDSDASRKKQEKKRSKEIEGPSAAGVKSAAVSTATPTDTTPFANGYSTPTSVTLIRNISRKRFIAQKQLALSDPKALAQIFMIK